MMEDKDYWAIGISAVALLISGAALLVSRAGYRLAREQDRREVEREQPAIDVQLPDCVGAGPWTAQYNIRNRATETLHVVGIRLPITIGPTPIPGRNPIRFADGPRTEHHHTEPLEREHGDYEVLMLERDLAAGESISGKFDLVSEYRSGVGGAMKIRLYVDAYLRDREQTVYRLPIDRMTRKDK